MITARDRVEKALETAKIRNLDMLFAAEFAQALLESWLEIYSALEGLTNAGLADLIPLPSQVSAGFKALASAREKLETNQEGTEK